MTCTNVDGRTTNEVGVGSPLVSKTKIHEPIIQRTGRLSCVLSGWCLNLKSKVVASCNCQGRLLTLVVVDGPLNPPTPSSHHHPQILSGLLGKTNMETETEDSI